MTSNPTLHIHPKPPIDLDTEPDAITVIAAGIGSMRTRRRARDAKPARNTVMLAIAVMESATGIDYNDDTAEYDGSDYDVAFTYVRSVLDDLPRSVWDRVCDLLHDGRPDAALRVIQAHHNVVQSLSNEPIPEWTNSVPPERIKQRPTAQPPTLVLQSTTEPREGYTYAKIDGLFYGPMPLNTFMPPVVTFDWRSPNFS